MEASVNEICVLIERLRLENDQVQLLQELNTLVTAVSAAQLAVEFNNISLEPIFDCLNTSESEQIDTGCDLLSRLLPHLSANRLLTYGTSIERGLNHPSERVKGLILEQLERFPVSLQALDGILPVVICSVGDENSAVAHSALRLVKTGISKGFFYLNSENIQALHQVIDQNTGKSGDEIRFRIYEIVACIAQYSSEGLEVMKQHDKLLPHILREAEGNDVLLKPNALEFLGQVVSTSHGFRFLEGTGTLAKLEIALSNEAENNSGFGAFLIPGLLKFFAAVCDAEPILVLQHYKRFRVAVFHLINENDQTLALHAWETLVWIAHSPKGKMALNSYAEEMSKAIKTMSAKTKGASDVRVRFVDSLSVLLQLQPDDQTEQLVNIVQQWFLLLWDAEDHVAAVSKTWELCRQPFSEIRVSGLKLFATIANQMWILQAFVQCPGFLEYLVDRQLQLDQQTRLAKYDIINNLVHSTHNLDTVFGSETAGRLREYVREGAVAHSRAEAQVAYEDAS